MSNSRQESEETLQDPPKEDNLAEENGEGEQNDNTKSIEDNENENTSGEMMLEPDEKRKKEAIGKMEKIEKEFADLKEKFFNEKIESLKKEYESIKNGTHQGLIKQCKQLEDAKEHKIWAAKKWRDYQLQNIENVYQAELKQSEDEITMEKKVIKEKMVNDAMEKKKTLLDEKESMHLVDNNDRVFTRSKRKKEDQPFSSYKKRLQPPHINYTLKETEIMEDLALIQRAQPTYGKWGKSSTEVYADHGKLYYHSQVFERGHDIYVEKKGEAAKWHGVIMSITPTELQIRSADNMKNRFPVLQIKNGRYTLTSIT